MNIEWRLLMIKKILGIILIILAIGIIILLGANKIIPWLFSEQYNENGVSHFLVITIDKENGKEYIGTLDNHEIYGEHLNIEETVFRTVEAENLSLKEAFEKELVSISDWRKHATRKRKEKDTEILVFDNYEIAITEEECIIRPIIR
jgi:hypothetical protein